MIKHIFLKLGNMRKAEEFIVYPTNETDISILIQSDHRCCRIWKDVWEGNEDYSGYLSKYCKNYPIFMEATKEMGATLIFIPQETMDSIIAIIPKSGDKIGSICTIA